MSANTCPYCNASLPPSLIDRGPCPRCGEVVDLPRVGLISTSPLAPAEEGFTGTLPEPPPAATYAKPAEANRRVGLIILGGMLFMAALGLAYALYTVATRRQHDKEIPRSSRRPVLPPLGGKKEVTPAAPARLAALAYLPEGCTVVAGVHVAELLDSPLGKQLRERKFTVGKEELSLNNADKWLGVPVGNIDHLALGCVLEKGGALQVPPTTVLVIRTIEPVGITSLRKALQAKEPRRVQSADGKTISVMSASAGKLPVKLWVPTSRTIVLSVEAEGLSSRLADGLERLVPPLRPVLEERLSTGTLAWVVGHSDDWKRPLEGLPLPKELPADELATARTFVVWVPAQKPLRVQAAVRFADEASARQAEGRAKMAGERLKFGREGEWLSLQLSVGE
jgi:hypothetical protein